VRIIIWNTLLIHCNDKQLREDVTGNLKMSGSIFLSSDILTFA